MQHTITGIYTMQSAHPPKYWVIIVTTDNSSTTPCLLYDTWHHDTDNNTLDGEIPREHVRLTQQLGFIVHCPREIQVPQDTHPLFSLLFLVPYNSLPHTLYNIFEYAYDAHSRPVAWVALLSLETRLQVVRCRSTVSLHWNNNPIFYASWCNNDELSKLVFE